LRTTRFGNGAEKVRKITVTKPDAMAARKKNQEENETLDDLEHNEDGRGCCYPPLIEDGSSPGNRCWGIARRATQGHPTKRIRAEKRWRL
jgi:hypothetical protein